MRKQHGLNAGPKPPPAFEAPAPAAARNRARPRRPGAWPHPGGDDALDWSLRTRLPHPKESGPPRGSSCTRPALNPKSDHDPVQRMTPSEDRRGPPLYRSGRGRGADGPWYAASAGNAEAASRPTPAPWLLHHGGRGGHGAEPHRPDLQKLGLKSADKYRSRQQGNQGSRWRGPGTVRVSNVKLKGDVP